LPMPLLPSITTGGLTMIGGCVMVRSQPIDAAASSASGANNPTERTVSVAPFLRPRRRGQALKASGVDQASGRRSVHAG
jgi:hypothetical protein